MRILQVRFKNLNSLAGEWEIDLTHPEFSSGGIFAITGPTGAGKTTILDAVCLALYARTPRLSKVTKAANEIMSRRTGECFAEVTFETQAGRYRCHWGQHRARKKPDGELQPPRHEIADADTGKVLESKLRDVAGRIERATGLDFDRFTRSILLAQGGFAAFLQAAPDERSPILEQITGTEVYSRISIRVHQLRAEERKKLEVLQAELEGMQLLEPERESRLRASLDELSGREDGLGKRIAGKSQAIAWREGIARLEGELELIGRQKGELQAELERFAPDRQRLEAAARALELAGDHSALLAVRAEQEADRRALGRCRGSLPKSQKTLKRLDEAKKSAAEKLGAAKAELQNALPMLEKVRGLDLKVEEKQGPIKTAEDSIAQLTASIEKLAEEHAGDSGELEGKRKALDSLLLRLKTAAADEGLVENLAGIRGKFEALQNLNSRLNDKQGEVAEAQSRLGKAREQWQKNNQALEKEKSGLQGIKDGQGEKSRELQTILDNRQAAEWRKSQTRLMAEKDSIAKALDAARALAESQSALDALAGLETELKSQAGRLANLAEGKAQNQQALEKEIGLLETNMALLQRIQDLEQARGQLKDGESCPLCGSKDHPYAKGNIPVPDETSQKLARGKGELKAVSEEISDIKVRLAQVDKDLEQAAAGRKGHARTIEEAKRLLAGFCAETRPELGLTPKDPGLAEKIQGLEQNNAKELELVDQTLKKADFLEASLNGLRQMHDKAAEAVARAERDAQAAAYEKQSAEKLIDRLNSEAAGLGREREQSLAALQGEARAYGVQNLSLETLGQTLAELESRRGQWLAGQKEKADLQRDAAELEKRTSSQAARLQVHEAELKKAQGHCEQLHVQKRALEDERRALFGDKEPGAEQKRLDSAVAEAEGLLDAARKAWAEADQELNHLKSKTADLEKAIADRDVQLSALEQAFLERLHKAGFLDEEKYKSARLPENERKELAQKSQQLADRQAGLVLSEREKTKLLETERRKRVTQEPLEGLKASLAGLLADQKDLQQQIGGISQKLKDNEALREKQRDRARAVDAQKSECDRWDLLHELIGSSDGKKYRNFAQGLTFEIMIGRANRQLRKMTDRYLLLHDDAKPLELNVMDNYQAGEVRSAKNLSGGESFIVSLALALGLSNMASRNVRVDSLFLDEGFGALDEEALDASLETLTGLRREGKVIGVISHVSALKERISAQIQVTPLTGGKSRLTGPGCAGR